LKKTNFLIIICTLVSLFYWYDVYSNFAKEYLVYSGNRLAQGALWTLVTSLFIHFDPIHLIGNMIFLYVFGRVVEEDAGAKLTMTAFLVGGVGSLIISSFYYGFNVSMIGASGAIFTLSAAAMLIKPLKSSWLFFFMPLGLVAILYFIFNVFAVSMNLGGNVGYMAHVTGFLLGIPFGIMWSKGEWVKNLSLTILLLIAFITMIYLIQFLLNFF